MYYLYEVRGSYRNMENYSRLIGYGFAMTPEMAADQACSCASKWTENKYLGRQAHITIKFPVKNGMIVREKTVE